MAAAFSRHAFWQRAETLIDLALDEDLPGPDLTTEALIEEDRNAGARIVAREAIVVSGLGIASRVFHRLDPQLFWEQSVQDGDRVPEGTVLAGISGNAAAILGAERTALNFLQHLSGIATATRQVVDLVKDFPAVVLDTRKTLPGWRLLEKEAVRHGGGTNHRYSLSDSVLIKDNHLALSGGVTAAVGTARRSLPPGTRIEVEVETLGQLEEAVQAGADVILFDNASPGLLAEAVAAAGGRVILEASGGINAENAVGVAAAGVDLVSMGSLTHSSRAVDISLDLTGED